MTAAGGSGRTYDGCRADPLPGLAGWYTVPARGVHFRLDGPDEALRLEVRHRGDNTARAELWTRDPAPAGEPAWSRDYPVGYVGFAPYQDVMAAARDRLGGSRACR